MIPSFFRWAVLVFSLAGGFFLVVWELLVDDPPPARQTGTPAAAAPAAGHVWAAPAPPPSVAPLPEPISAWPLFAFNRTDLESAEAAKLEALIEAIKQAAVERIDAVGHADRIGPMAYNLNLSQRRAEAVKAHLVRLGADAGLVRVSAKGEAEPATGDGCMDMGLENRRNRALVECLQPDRRVVVTVLSGR